jgi:hypothetical protein
MDASLIPAILWLFCSALQSLTTTSSLDGLKAHTATPVFLFTAQVYFLDLASQLNHSIISLSSKLSGKMRIASYGYSKRNIDSRLLDLAYRPDTLDRKQQGHLSQMTYY